MAIENLLKYIEAIMILLPLVEKVVEMIERLFSGFTGGETKSTLKHKAAVGILGPISDEAGISSGALSGMIDGIVRAKNAAGEFKHSA